jgi:hypothetical protein
VLSPHNPIFLDKSLEVKTDKKESKEGGEVGRKGGKGRVKGGDLVFERRKSEISASGKLEILIKMTVGSFTGYNSR